MKRSSIRSLISAWIGCGLLSLGASTSAFQIAPLGTQHEARLTRQSDSTLSAIAGKLGVLIKKSVHEEITHLARGCEVEPGQLMTDTFCGRRDVGVASPFVIYGVRWNDLPPFRLLAGEGDCHYLGLQSCRTDQTIRFSTQPMCWYCLFRDADRIAKTNEIAGCKRGARIVRGNVMTRSHFGDLQFLHVMASREGIHPVATRAEILDWLEFAWKVSSREIGAQAMLKQIEIPTIKDRFGCTDWRVADLYLLGRQDRESNLMPQLREIAFGSVLHTVQDSFSASHATRESTAPNASCENTTYPAVSRVIEFHTYGAQDGHLHDGADSRDAMVAANGPDEWAQAITVTRNLFDLRESGARWEQAAPYFACVFELSEERQASSPGQNYRRVAD